MARALQKRTLQTRARLITAAEQIIAEQGFDALRVEEVVLRAGTAKGTFFAHFKDKDALLTLILGAQLAALLDDMSKSPAPQSVQALIAALMPLSDLMTCERYVFDLLLRHSGAASLEETGPIAETFGRQIEVFDHWMQKAGFRSDIPTDLQAEGIQAFLLQAMAAKFCALHNATSVGDRLGRYLEAWLRPERIENKHT